MTFSKTITSSLCFSTLLFISACGAEQEASKPEAMASELKGKTEQISQAQPTLAFDDFEDQTSEAQPTLLERAKAAAAEARKTDPSKSWDAVGKSSEEIWEKSKKTSQDVVTLGTESSKEAWEKSKELWKKSKDTSKELWEEGKESSSEIWNNSKETSKELWDKSTKELDKLMNQSEQSSESDAFDKANEAFEPNEI
mgnify:CR=1 FL=1